MIKSVWRHNASGHTVRRKKIKSPPFVMLPKYMLKSAAWYSLPCIARAAYLQVALRYDGANNGRIAISARRLGAELGVNQTTASRALRHLLDRGFIEVARQSGFNVKGRVATEYRLTAYRCDVTGGLPAKTFMKWLLENSLHRGATRASQRRYESSPPSKTRSQRHERLYERSFETFHRGTDATHIESTIPPSDNEEGGVGLLPWSAPTLAEVT
jgi:DNA-binding transcriptional regulator YhcF (GntR family)